MKPFHCFQKENSKVADEKAQICIFLDGSEVIKLFFMLSSAETKIYTALLLAF